jgi:hypothetical protein
MDHRHGEPANEYYAAQNDGAAINMLVWREALEFMFSPRDPHEVCRQILKLEEDIAAGEGEGPTDRLDIS